MIGMCLSIVCKQNTELKLKQILTKKCPNCGFNNDLSEPIKCYGLTCEKYKSPPLIMPTCTSCSFPLWKNLISWKRWLLKGGKL